MKTVRINDIVVNYDPERLPFYVPEEGGLNATLKVFNETGHIEGEFSLPFSLIRRSPMSTEQYFVHVLGQHLLYAKKALAGASRASVTYSLAEPGPIHSTPASASLYRRSAL